VAPAEAALKEKIVQMDLVGGVLATGTLSCFVLAIHGAAEYGWRASRSIGGFIGFGILLLCFLVNEWWMSEKAMVQAHLLKNRRILSNLFFIFFIAGAFFPMIYTLPVQFQTVNAKSASQSGMMLIPLVLGISVWTMFSNGALTFWRHYKPFLVVGAILATAGNANIYTLDTTTSNKAWVGSLILSATGIGLALQMPMISNQASVGVEDLAAVTAITFFLENTGITIFVASAEASFTMGLVSSLTKNVPNIDPHAVLQAGATQARYLFQSADLEKIIQSYLDGCRTSHLISVSCASAACLVALTGAGGTLVQEFRLRLKKMHAR
jgi:MFS family permease